MSPRKRKVPQSVNISDFIAPFEAEVMEIIWVRGASLVTELTEVLNSRRPEALRHNTVLTICTRLSERGLLAPEREGRAYRYSPTMTRAEFLADQASIATGELLERFGDVALAKFVDEVSGNPDRLAALRDLLKEPKK